MTLDTPVNAKFADQEILVTCTITLMIRHLIVTCIVVTYNYNDVESGHNEHRQLRVGSEFLQRYGSAHQSTRTARWLIDVIQRNATSRRRPQSAGRFNRVCKRLLGRNNVVARQLENE